ncbi:MAG: PA domain-containing protein, partial [Lysobacter sp.]
MTGKYLSTAIALVLCLGAGAAQAGSVVLVNVDPVGSGLNDTTPATPVGANPGVTVGEQRRIAYQFAGDLWGAVLVSAVPIKVQASFAALSCTANAGTLGSAGPSTAFYNFNRAPQLDTWYHSALADAISGVDLANGNGVDIVSRFNANLGKPDCLASQKWYYGLDGVTPAGSVNFLDVVMHEIGHGLGFSSFVNKATGALMQGKSDAFSTPVFDNRSGLSWVAMTDAQRSAAIVGGGLVFTGASAKAEAPLFLSERLSLKASGTLAANYEFGTASFGPEATSLNFNAAAVVVNDGTATGSRGCRQLTNAASVANKIAVADAGGCISGDKAFYAELAGAIGIIIVNNVAGPAPNVADGYSNNNIPTVTLSQTDGSALKAAVPGVTAALAKIAGQYQGT